ncbi:hypothetical protein PVL29_011490 [Vitis rotundifolia]|uniref:RING-type domain-containing protein n=1 Tax=Vitis rotundifolia TaxID=103349 RepID=A0AA39DPP0_VITRO|nr:hypothetical protein PVL29_011490 [Vitis rotundifolia]
MENQNDRHHIIEITRNPENIPSIPTTQASSTTSKIHRVWIIFQLLVCVCQIIVSVVILWWSEIHDNPENRRVVWLVGYTSGCLALLPLIYISYRIEGAMMNRCLIQRSWFPSCRLYAVVEVLKVVLGCFFAFLIVLGHAWVARVSSDADKLDTLYQVLLKTGCIAYAIPAIGCFLLPRMISSALMAPRNLTVTTTPDLFIFKAPPTRANSFNTLPTYRFKLKKNGTDAVGVLAAGTEQERAIPEEDALPCGHFFHKECVDEWLKINARCPLCQSEIGRTHGASTFAAGSSQNPSERRTGSALDEGGGGHGSTVA